MEKLYKLKIVALYKLIKTMCIYMLDLISIAYDAHPEGKEDFLKLQRWVQEIQKTIKEDEKLLKEMEKA